MVLRKLALLDHLEPGLIRLEHVEDLAGDLDRQGGVGALRSRQLPLPDCVGQVGHPLRRLRADRLQGHAARVHALEQADSGAEQHG